MRMTKAQHDKIWAKFNDIATPEDRFTYNSYKKIYNWLLMYANQTDSHIQRAANVFNLILYTTNDLIATEQAYRYKDALYNGASDRAKAAAAKCDMQRFNEISLNNYLADPEQSERIKGYREILYQSLQFIKSFNKVIDIIADVKKMDDITVKKATVPISENVIAAYNERRCELHELIEAGTYQSNEIRAQKLEALDAHWPPLATKHYYEPDDVITQLKRLVRAFPVDEPELFTIGNDQLIAILFLKNQEAYRGKIY